MPSFFVSDLLTPPNSLPFAHRDHFDMKIPGSRTGSRRDDRVDPTGEGTEGVWGSVTTTFHLIGHRPLPPKPKTVRTEIEGRGSVPKQ